ncbi:MAG: hypothetical protein ACOC22_01085 [bacterium]
MNTTFRTGLFKVEIAGEILELTDKELHDILTVEAYELYWKVLRQKGYVKFGYGAIDDTY